jgi:hypothetical protein
MIKESAHAAFSRVLRDLCAEWVFDPRLYLFYTKAVSGVCFGEQTEGNPVRGRNCPAAVIRNESFNKALVLASDREAEASREPVSPKTCQKPSFEDRSAHASEGMAGDCSPFPAVFPPCLLGSRRILMRGSSPYAFVF